MPVGAPAEFKVAHMNNWLQGHSLQFLFQEKFIIIRFHLAPNIAGLGTSRSNGYLLGFFLLLQKTKQLATWNSDLIIIIIMKKKSHCHSFVGVGFFSEWWALNSLFNKSSSLRGRRRAQKSFTFYKCLSGIIYNIMHYPGVCFRVMLLHLLPYNFPEITHLRIYIHGNQSNIEKLGNNWSGFELLQHKGSFLDAFLAVSVAHWYKTPTHRGREGKKSVKL